MSFKFWDFSLSLVGQTIFSALYKHQALLLLILLSGSRALASSSFPTCIGRILLNTGGGSSAELQSSVCTALSFQVVYPATSSYLSLPGLSVPSPELREPAGFCLGSPSLPWLRNFLKTVISDNHRIHLVCFLSYMYQCPLISDI